MKRMILRKNTFLMAVITLLLTVSGLSSIVVAESTETQITTNTGDQLSPVIYENIVVWSDERSGNSDIYMKDLTTGVETAVTTNSNEQVWPSTYGDKIVWQDDRNEISDDGNSDIYMYDLTAKKESRITSNSSAQTNPAIYGDKIVWADYRNGNADIYLYDLKTKTEVRITNDNGEQVLPAIYGDKIVWQDQRNDDQDIYLYSLSTKKEIKITTDSSYHFNPSIYEDKVVWFDYRNGNADIYLYNITTGKETQITTDVNNQYSPSIHQDKVVWTDYRNGDADIYVKDLTNNAEIRVTTDTNDQLGAAMNQGQVVWYDFRNNNWDIYYNNVFPKVVIKPATPTGLAVGRKTSNSLELKWNPVVGATNYKLYKSTTQNGTFTQIYTGYGTVKTDTNLTPATTYYYKVSAVNEMGESPQSSAISETTDKLDNGKTPTGLKTGTITESSIALSWNPVAGATSYKLYRGSSLSGQYVSIYTGTATAAASTYLKAGTTYYYKVSAIHSDGESPFSEAVSATTKDAVTAPVVPTGLASGAKTDKSITLSWNPSAGAAGYKLYRATTAAGPYTIAKTVDATSVVDDGLMPSTTYYYKVSATNSSGESDKSPAFTEKTEKNVNEGGNDGGSTGGGGNGTGNTSGGGGTIINPPGDTGKGEDDESKANDIVGTVGQIDTTNTEKATKELVDVIERNKENLNDSDVKKKVLEIAQSIAKNASSVDITNTVARQTDEAVTFDIKDGDAVEKMDRISSIVDEIKTSLPESFKGEKNKFKKEVLIALDSTTTDKQIRVALSDAILDKANDKAVDIVIQQSNVKFRVTPDSMTVNELTETKQTASENGGKAYIELSQRKLENVSVNNRNLRLVGSPYEFEAYVVSKNSAGEIDDSNIRKISKFAKKLQVEIDFSSIDLHSITSIDKLGVYTQNEAGDWIYIRSKIDRVNKKIVFDTSHFSKYAIMESDRSFSDVGGNNWAKEYIELLAAKQITDGLDENNFGPRGLVTRAQFATFIVRALDIETRGYEGIFNDVNSNAWYTPWVEAAAKAGLVQGDGGYYNPNATITREQMAVMIMRAHKYLTGNDISEEAKKSAAQFKDNVSISDWAKDAVYGAQANGIVSGMDDNSFNPKGNAQRDQAAKMLIELLKVTGEM